MEPDVSLEYDEGLENADPLEDEGDLGDAIKDGASNVLTPGNPGR